MSRAAYALAIVVLPKYENWAGYENNVPFLLRRYGGLWGRGT